MNYYRRKYKSNEIFSSFYSDMRIGTCKKNEKLQNCGSLSRP